MENVVPFSEYINNVKCSNAAREMIPMGINAGWPSISIRNQRICVTIPYFKTGMLEPNDKTPVFPIRYCLTTVWPYTRLIEFVDLKFVKDFTKYDYDQPIGTFRHEALQSVGKTEYLKMRDELLSCYDELIACVVEKRPFERQTRMAELMQVLVEPSLKPMYLGINKSFYTRFLGE